MKKSFSFLCLLTTLVMSGCASSTSSTQPSSSVSSEAVDSQVSSSVEESSQESHFTLNINEEEIMSVEDANDSFFDDDKQSLHESVLKGKNIYWLGSSVTQGSQSQGVTMVEYLDATCGTISTKEALSGTTVLTTEGDKKSYVQRMINSTKFKKDKSIDAFICQISTNDAKNANVDSWGEMTQGDPDMDSLDLTTTLGGMEYIVKYVHQNWNCPIYFYSGAYFGDKSTYMRNTDPSGEHYEGIINKTIEVVNKYRGFGYDIDVIDLYHDDEFTVAVSEKFYKWSRSDAIHPKKAGYLYWWTPYFEQFLSQKLA